jgi:nucleotide-binding universal stress UspA family protein
VEEGVPAQAIDDVARREKADLIVMATHGRSGWRRFLFGSVAERVIRTTCLPVLVIPPPEGCDD